ncbi:MAG: hypothetical protein SFZ23_04875 [Planctomycetota bacterium]|nr:hypothetical protein [Planctomycetota bacterium]
MPRSAGDFMTGDEVASFTFAHAFAQGMRALGRNYGALFGIVLATMFILGVCALAGALALFILGIALTPRLLALVVWMAMVKSVCIARFLALALHLVRRSSAESRKDWSSGTFRRSLGVHVQYLARLIIPTLLASIVGVALHLAFPGTTEAVVLTAAAGGLVLVWSLYIFARLLPAYLLICDPRLVDPPRSTLEAVKTAMRWTAGSKGITLSLLVGTVLVLNTLGFIVVAGGFSTEFVMLGLGWLVFFSMPLTPAILTVTYELLATEHHAFEQRNSCRSCGYLLTGLATNTCPECGMSFETSDRVGAFVTTPAFETAGSKSGGT